MPERLRGDGVEIVQHCATAARGDDRIDDHGRLPWLPGVDASASQIAGYRVNLTVGKRKPYQRCAYFTLTDHLTVRILLSYTPEMGVYDDLAQCTGFDWDHGNEGKNWEKHRVSDGEAEEIFFNDPLIAGTDEAHSTKERRYFALSQTNAGRPLFVVFTIRKTLIRIISAREMTNRELRRYRS